MCGDNMLSPLLAIMAGTMKLIDIRTRDGSRLYLHLPQTVGWHDLRDHATRLPGAEVTRFVAEGVAQRQLEFSYRGYSFFIQEGGKHFSFFVRDPQCPDLIVYQVAQHFQDLVEQLRGLLPTDRVEEDQKGGD
jgi:hypothetical protein